MNAAALKQWIADGKLDDTFALLYGTDQLDAQKARYAEAVDEFTALYGDRDNLALFSAPGRTEIAGNHTDHNHGRVVAASVNLDVIAVVSANDSPLIRIKSRGYRMDTVDVNDLAIRPEEDNKAISLIRGTAARFLQKGWKAGGLERSRKIKSEYPGVQKAGAGRRERPFADGRPAGRSSVFCVFRGLSRVPGTGFRARFRRQGGSAPGSFVDAPGKPLVAFQEFETGIDGRFVPDAGGRYGRSAGIRAFRRVCLSFVAAVLGRGGGAGEEGGFEKIKQTETFHIEKNPLFSQFSPKIAAKTRRFCLL